MVLASHESTVSMSSRSKTRSMVSSMLVLSVSSWAQTAWALPPASEHGPRCQLAEAHPHPAAIPGRAAGFLSSDLLHELASQMPRPSHPASPLSHRGGRPCCRMQNEPSGRWRSPWAPTLQSRNRRTPMAARLEFPAPSRVWPFTTVGRAHLSQYLKPISQKKTDLRIRTLRFG